MKNLNSKDIKNLELFLDCLQVEKGSSLNTIDAYSRDLKDFILFLNQRRPKQTLTTAGTTDIKDYLSLLQKRQLTGKTKSRKLSAIKNLFGFLLNDNIISEDPSLNIKNPKIEKTLPKYLTEEEVEKLLIVAKGQKNPMLYTMLELLYATGIRVSELVSLKKTALIEEGNFILVRGKGEKERIIPVNAIAKQAIILWLQVRNNFIKVHMNNQDFLFPSNRSKTGYLSRERFAQLLKQLAIDSNMDYNKISPHIIRHSFASHILNNGGNLKVIQDMLGHSNISTTEIYTHIMEDKLKDAVFNNHPLAKLKTNKMISDS